MSIALDSSGNILTCHALASTINLASLCNAMGRSVDSANKKCAPPSVFAVGDIPILTKQYMHCQGGSGSGEHVLALWTSTGTGMVRVSWAGMANDNSVNWKIYKNSDIIASNSGSGLSTFSDSKDVEIKAGETIKQTVSLRGGVDSDCVGDGSLMISVDLLNMM